jgi:hypothetical protein
MSNINALANLQDLHTGLTAALSYTQNAGDDLRGSSRQHRAAGDLRSEVYSASPTGFSGFRPMRGAR